MEKNLSFPMQCNDSGITARVIYLYIDNVVRVDLLISLVFELSSETKIVKTSKSYGAVTEFLKGTVSIPHQ